jgi:hypothetical protein
MKVGPVIRVYRCGEKLSEYEHHNEETQGKIRALGCVLRDVYTLYSLIDDNQRHQEKPEKIRTALRAIVESQERVARRLCPEIGDEESERYVDALCLSPVVSEETPELLVRSNLSLDQRISMERYEALTSSQQACMLTRENLSGWCVLVSSVLGLFQLQLKLGWTWEKTSILTTRYVCVCVCVQVCSFVFFSFS